jgi:hypothetical protein
MHTITLSDDEMFEMRQLIDERMKELRSFHQNDQFQKNREITMASWRLIAAKFA